MLKKYSIFALVLVLALLLAACGEPAPLPDEDYEPVSYELFPIPEGGYVGDVMPFVTDDGQLELYYL